MNIFHLSEHTNTVKYNITFRRIHIMSNKNNQNQNNEQTKPGKHNEKHNEKHSDKQNSRSK